MTSFIHGQYLFIAHGEYQSMHNPSAGTNLHQLALTWSVHVEYLVLWYIIFYKYSSIFHATYLVNNVLVV